MSSQVVEKTGRKIRIEVEIELGGTMQESEEAILHGVNEVGQLATEQALLAWDTNGEVLVWEGERHTSKGQMPKEYQTPYGPVTVRRHMYQTRRGGKTHCPMEQGARVIITSTPRFAKMVTQKYVDMQGVRSVLLDLEQSHGRLISKEFVQQMAETVGTVAQAREESWDYELPKLSVPVASVTVGLDGANVLTVDDGWRQAMTGTLALYDREGQRLHTVYVAASPEYGKATFLERFGREVARMQQRFAHVPFIGLADGAKDNWTFLRKHTTVQTLDFYHVTEYLTEAADILYARAPSTRSEWLESACHRLKHEPGAVEVLLTELHPKEGQRLSKEDRKRLQEIRTYLTNHRNLMTYPDNLQRHFPIGSGVTEAACKVIIKQRLCAAGMRWKEPGVAVVLTLRCLTHTPGRWKQFWDLVDQVGFTN